jgi:hypothetical protein
MASRPKDSRDARRAAAAALRAEQERAERRRRRLLVVVVAGIALALVIPVAVVLVTQTREQARVDAVAERPIVGEKEVEVGSARHVSDDVPYEAPAPVPAGTSLPPVGGDHDPTPQNCGFYDQPVRDENAVHSLEHGAVWLAYRADLESADIARLKEIAQGTPYVLASPYDDLAAPVVATAWGVQLELEDTSDERLDAFLLRYVQGEQTPEPGAPCDGGVGTPIS